MGQLERYGLYVLCVVIFLILGVALWGGDPNPALAAPPAVVADAGRDAKPQPEKPPVALEAKPQAKSPMDDEAVARLRRAFGRDASAPKEAPAADDGDLLLEPLASEEQGARQAPPAPQPAPERREYVIKKDDRLEDIALAFLGDKNAWRDIVKANPGLRPTKMQVGERIVIPARGAPERSAPQPAASADEYVIKKGDVLESIALAKLGKRSLWRAIADANPGLEPKDLQPGKVIKIPARVEEKR